MKAKLASPGISSGGSISPHPALTPKDRQASLRILHTCIGDVDFK